MGNAFEGFKKNLSIISNDIIPNGVKIETYSNKEAVIEGCKGILEYSDSYIKLNIGCGCVCFAGKGLYAHSFCGDAVVLRGKINTIEYCVGR